MNNAERERLELFIEEASEAIQIACKVLRFGYEGRAPGSATDNRSDLEQELGDVRYAMLLLCSAADLDKRAIHLRAHAKSVSVQRWLVHQSEALLETARKAAGS